MSESNINDHGNHPDHDLTNGQVKLDDENNEDDMEIVQATTATSTSNINDVDVNNPSESTTSNTMDENTTIRIQEEERNLIAPSPFEIINLTTNPPTTASSDTMTASSLGRDHAKFLDKSQPPMTIQQLDRYVRQVERFKSLLKSNNDRLVETVKLQQKEQHASEGRQDDGHIPMDVHAEYACSTDSGGDGKDDGDGPQLPVDPDGDVVSAAEDVKETGDPNMKKPKKKYQKSLKQKAKEQSKETGIPREQIYEQLKAEEALRLAAEKQVIDLYTCTYLYIYVIIIILIIYLLRERKKRIVCGG